MNDYNQIKASREWSGQAEETSEVRAGVLVAAEALRKQLAVIADALCSLEDRLGPVLSPAPSMGGDEAKLARDNSARQRSSLYETLTGAQEQADHLNRRVAQIRSALDL